MTDTPQADALLTNLISGEPQIEAFATLTEAHEREKALYVLLALLTDPSWTLRYRAAQALGAMGDKRAAEFLRERVERRIEGTSALEAMTDALVDLGDLDAIVPLFCHPWAGASMYKSLMRFHSEDVLRAMEKALTHPVANRHVLGFLRRMKTPAAIPLLIKALKDEGADIRASAVEYLIGAAEAVPFLITYTADPDRHVRQSVAYALGESGDQQVIPALLLMLKDDNPHVQLDAACALGRLGDASGLDLIHRDIVFCADWPSIDCFNAIRALRSLGKPPMPLLIKLVDRQSRETLWRRPETVILIAEIFAEQGDPAALPALEKNA